MLMLMQNAQAWKHFASALCVLKMSKLFTHIWVIMFTALCNTISTVTNEFVFGYYIRNPGNEPWPWPTALYNTVSWQ